MKVECSKIVVEGKVIPEIIDLDLPLGQVVSFQFYRAFIKRALQAKLGKVVEDFKYKILTF